MGTEFLSDIADTLDRLCAALAAGDDVSPADLYRLEGAIDTAIRCGLASQEDVAQLLASPQRKSIVLLSDPGNPVRLQMTMATAPVFPSTKQS